MSYVNDIYPANGHTYNIPSGQSATIDLGREGVPDEAYEVVVFAKIATGNCSGYDRDGELTVSTSIPNGTIERKVYCRYYGQSAWAYNSENISLPIKPGGARFVNVSVDGPNLKNFKASAQVVGYRKPS